MKLHLHNPSRTGLALAFGILISAGIWASPARATEWDKKTILTVRDQPIQIRETVLEPGQYVLKLLDSASERHIVQIFNRDQTHIINTVFAVPTMRMRVSGDTQFTFWETPPGTAKAMRDWYYPGDEIGQEFPYPKHLQQIAMLTPAPIAAPEPAPQPSQASAEPQPEPPAPEPAAPAPTPEPEQQPVEVAQNSTPAPAAPETSKPAELPKTGSQYPLIGLGGGVLLGLYSLLRFRSKRVG